MPTLADTARLLKLKAKIEAMTTGDQLRLVAGLLDQGEWEIAETLLSNLVDALRAARLKKGGR